MRSGGGGGGGVCVCVWSSSDAVDALLAAVFERIKKGRPES